MNRKSYLNMLDLSGQRNVRLVVSEFEVAMILAALQDSRKVSGDSVSGTLSYITDRIVDQIEPGADRAANTFYPPSPQ